MSILLRLAALLSAISIAVLVFLREQVLPPASLEPMATVLANTLVVAQLGFGFLFLQAARAPREHLGTVYVAIFVMAGKVIVHLYHSLVLLPSHTAILTILDLVLSFALLVGMLEALPRLFARSEE